VLVHGRSLGDVVELSVTRALEFFRSVPLRGNGSAGLDPEIARHQEPYDGMEFILAVERIEPMRLFSFRWHPGGNEAGPDTPDAEMTLVEFVLEDTAEGVRLTITESGFERVPLARRAQAIADNTGGWAAQTSLIAKYLQQQAG